VLLYVISGIGPDADFDREIHGPDRPREASAFCSGQMAEYRLLFPADPFSTGATFGGILRLAS
jgi:hypothetical protein